MPVTAGYPFLNDAKTMHLINGKYKKAPIQLSQLNMAFQQICWCHIETLASTASSGRSLALSGVNMLAKGQACLIVSVAHKGATATTTLQVTCASVDVGMSICVWLQIAACNLQETWGAS